MAFSNRVGIICTLILCFLMLVVLIKIIIELKTPRYIKPKSFLLMDEHETPLSNIATNKPINIKHSYISDVIEFHEKENGCQRNVDVWFC